jgi:phosphoribosyl 1,2-cyclic phosphodiesterase
MVRFTVLASGSKGNCTVVSGGRTRILVDCGLSCRELFRRMKLTGEEPAALDAILITHEHSDHVNGLSVTARKLNIPVYVTEATHQAWIRSVTPRKRMTRAQWMEQYREQAPEEPSAGDTSQADTSVAQPESAPSNSSLPSRKEKPAWLPAVEHFQAGEAFEIGDIAISPFTTPHDAADPVGFVFRAEGVRMGFATDLGYVPPNVSTQLQGVDLLMLESNHDLEMLRDGPYPWSVKQRVLSRVGHLSNEAAAEFFAQGYDGQAVYVILAHLSESNNLPSLARVTAERALQGRLRSLANRLLLATQYDPLPPIVF